MEFGIRNSEFGIFIATSLTASLEFPPACSIKILK